MEDIPKYALITGASSGIGLHFAEALAEKGYSIVAVSNQQEQLEELKKRLEELYRIRVTILNIDLARENSTRQVFDYCNERHIEVEVLINNAGIFFFKEVAEVDYSLMKSILNLHIITPALLCRLFGEQMIQRQKGFILNVSSISAVMPYPCISLYGPTKTFIRSFTRAFRTEMKFKGINVTCLIPGAVDTGLYNASQFNTLLLKKLGIMKRPDTIANAGVRALISNRAECIPGFLNKLIIVLLPVIPHFIISTIYRKKFFERKQNN